MIKKIILNNFNTNTYIIKKNKKTVIIDPSFYFDSNFKKKKINKILNSLIGNNLEAIFLTHGHLDHFYGINEIIKKYNCNVYIHNHDKNFLYNENLNLSLFLNNNKIYKINFIPKIININIKKINIKKIIFEIFHCPGHTPGSICYFYKNICFSGDFIFKNSIGRTDLPKSNKKTMFNSIKKFIIKNKNKNLIIFPGHGNSTNFKKELKNNYFFINIIKKIKK